MIKRKFVNTVGKKLLGLKRLKQDAIAANFLSHFFQLHRKEQLKERRKAKRAPNFTNNLSPGFDSDIFQETDYYFQNGN